MSDNSEESLKLKLLGPAAESAGQTLQDVWDVVFGRFHLYAQKKRFSNDRAFEEFKSSVEQRVIEIPSDSIKEPKLSILGPTLDASKFYFEEKPLREMFATLASASMDARKERDLHPSYPEIIKQMSPLDAQNLSLFKTQLPVAEYYLLNKERDTRRTILTNVFLENTDVQDLIMQSRSLASLSRLGLLEIEYETILLAEKFYEKFLLTPYFLSAGSDNSNEIAGIRPGRARLTPFGKSFTSVCLG